MLSFLHSPALTSIHDHWKTMALTRWTFVGKAMSLLLNMLSRLVITFLPRSKRLLISWLQSPSAVIWGELGARGEGDHRGWDGWMASPTLWTWVWVNSLSWWWTGRPAAAAAAAAKLLQSCPTLHNPRDGSPPGSPIPGILQARTLEWVTISFSNAWKWKVKLKSLSRVQLLATPWTAAYQAPPSMVFSRQEYWSGVSILYWCF